MIDIINSIFVNVLTGLYVPFWYAVLLSILVMFFLMYAEEHGYKELVRKWVQSFKRDKLFRKTFLLVFFTVMILFQTLLNRHMYNNPLSEVMGGWWIYKPDGSFTTECFENLVMFIPFTVLLFWTYRERIIGDDVRLIIILWKSIKIVFLFSFTIEFLQLFLRLGTWQLSDLFYNTLGGFIGGLIYWIGYRIEHKESH